MQIVIDIPEVFYEYCKAREDAIEIELAVKNGIPLSEYCTYCAFYEHFEESENNE